ncbi:peroxiredoxin [Candidatus Gottesmanbacteria bacterium]|nr:peroxiredoxin [Candidatus Gottesmanbacteria bacterium]
MHAPDFSLQDQGGKTHRLADYRGRWLVLYSYPKDDTPGCTKEACGFRDAMGAFTKLGIVVLGISKDSVALHKRFAQKYNLPFSLLSDPEHKALEALGAWGKKAFMGRTFMGTLRRTYIINPKGEIVKEYPNVTPATHAAEVLTDFDLLMREAS